VNWQHLSAFLWLRRRLLVNELKRAGLANAVLLALLAVFAVATTFVLFVVGFFLGLFVLADASPLVLLLVWDGVTVVFLFVWTVTTLADAQRSEALSLNKCLQFPVSPGGAFLVNYLSSLFSLTLLDFVSAVTGLSLGLSLSRGPMFLLALPLLAAFLLMVTGLRNQFQGWLASLMADKRRRRAVILGMVVGSVLFAQLPPWLILHTVMPPSAVITLGEQRAAESKASSDALHARADELRRDFAARRISATQFKELSEANIRDFEAACEKQQQTWQEEWEANGRRAQERGARIARVASLVLPPGWLPLGVAAAAEGDPWPAAAGIAGLALIGTASLRRSYRTTLRLYTGEYTAGGKRAGVAALPAGAPTAVSGRRVLLLERRIPGASERVSAIALGAFRSALRAPEIMLLLISPVVGIVVPSLALAQLPVAVPEPSRPLLTAAGMAFVLMGMIGIVGNQFGFDRGGFRVFVLSGISRRDVLLGKNLAFAPFALGLCTALAVAVQCLFPMSADRFAVCLLRFVSGYLLFCMAGNLLSVLLPSPVFPGTLQRSSLRVLTIMVGYFAFVIFVLPLIVVTTLLPGILAMALDGPDTVGALTRLSLELAGCLAVALLYNWVLTREGNLLQAREQQILEVVTPKAE
jgi:hypothetical protein